MTYIVNLTPHSLDILVEAADGIEVTVGRGPSARTASVWILERIPPSGMVAGAREELVDSSPIVLPGGFSIPVVSRRFGAPTNLPEPEQGKVLFVSALTLSAAVAAGRDVSDLLTPGLLATKDGKPFGVLSFARQG